MRCSHMLTLSYYFFPGVYTLYHTYPCCSALLSQLDNIDKNNIIMSNSPVWKIITITVGCTLVAMFLVLAGIYLFKLKINTKRKYSISHPIPKREPKNNDLELGTFGGPGRGLSTSRGSSLNADPELTTALRSTTIENEL